jgi:hypothetical protein
MVKQPKACPKSWCAIMKAEKVGTKSVINSILDRLQAGNTINQLEAIRLYGTTRLASAISDLRNKRGFNIKTEIIKVTAAKGKETEHDASPAVYHLLDGAWDGVYKL